MKAFIAYALLLSTLVALFYFFLTNSIDETKRAYTCAECRMLQWRYTEGWRGNRVVDVPNSCSDYVAQKSLHTHQHLWIRSRDCVWLNPLGKTIAWGSGDIETNLWMITPDDQLAIYEKCEDPEAFDAARQFFRRFGDCLGDRYYQYEIFAHFEKLQKQKRLNGADFEFTPSEVPSVQAKYFAA